MSGNELKEQGKELANKYMQKISAYAFYAVLVFAAGVWGGITYSNNSNAGVTENAIKLGGFIFKGNAYDVSQRPLPMPSVPAGK